MAGKGNPEWKKGKSGNPAGKPKGTKNKTSAEIKEYLFSLHSPSKTKKWAEENYELFVTKVIIPLLPKEVQAEIAGELKIRILDCLGPKPTE